MTWTPPDPSGPSWGGYQPPGQGHRPVGQAQGHRAPGHGLPPFPSPVPAHPPFSHPAGPPQKPTGPARRSWRLAHSAWVVTPMLPFGCLSATGFLYVGVRARRPAWAIAGVLYSVITNICFFLGSEGAEGSAQQNICYTIMFLLWPISVAHALIINSSWLRWRAGHVPWYSQAQSAAWTGPAIPTATPLPPQLQDVVPAPAQFYGTPTTATSPAPTSAGPFAPTPGGPFASASGGAAYGSTSGGPGFDSTSGGSTSPPVTDPTATPVSPPWSAAMPSVTPFPAPPPLPEPTSGWPPPSPSRAQPSTAGPRAAPLDVNIATEQQLAAIPGLGAERAARIMAARHSRGSFHGLSEVAAVAALAPHEFVSIRAHLSCEPPPPPDAGEPSPFGRIVDV